MNLKLVAILALITETQGWGLKSFMKGKLSTNEDHGFGHSMNRDSKMILGEFL